MFKEFTSDADDVIIKEFRDNKLWGIETLVNVYGADKECIKDPVYILEFVEDLCDLIDMKRYGEPFIERFGEGELYGYTLVQPIYTSCITAHFSEIDGRIFFDIFSCKDFPPSVVAKFCMNYFHGTKEEHRTLLRD
jgi:hypothetical protein